MVSRVVPSNERIADFADPPVVETVFGVQFSPLRNFTSAHFGWFWKRHLDEQWPRAVEVPFLPDQFELFDEPGSRSAGSAPAFLLRSGPASERMQFVSATDDRVIQLQSTKLLYNWRKRSREYPVHDQRMKEFSEVFDRFRRFVADSKCGDLALNQWEVTYINQIPQGPLWTTPRDWHRIIPTLVTPWVGTADRRLESLSAEWHHEIEPHMGRLHIAVGHRRTAPPDSKEVLALELTARGPISDKRAVDFETGLNRGRQAIVETFVAITSPEARDHWSRNP